jgi:hypothetical protein
MADTKDIEVFNASRAPRVFYDADRKAVEIAPQTSAKFKAPEALAKKIEAMADDPASGIKLGSAESHKKTAESTRERLDTRPVTKK